MKPSPEFQAATSMRDKQRRKERREARERLAFRNDQPHKIFLVKGMDEY